MPPSQFKFHSRRSASNRNTGFTLLELLVVMVIIGLLAGYVGPKLFGQIGKSQIKVTRAQIDGLAKALDQYRIDTGHYPNSEQGLASLTQQPAGEPKWSGPYMAKGVPKDPWGTDYRYVAPGEHGDYDLMSYGRDGQPGGTGEDADVTNW
jgi:general secretion pathway protein G